MLKRPSERDQIAALLDQFSAAVKAAFLEAVAEIKSRVVLNRIIERLDRGDIPGAIEAMHLERAPFNPLLDKLAEAFAAGGGHQADNLPILRDPQGFRVVFRFDVRNPAAEQWLRDHSAQLVTNIIEDQRQAVRTALASGLARGDNPRRTALDIVGRVSRASGARVGGTIGLTSNQTAAVDLASAELSGGQIDAMRRYLTRERRDRRFDRTVLKAIDEGRALPKDMVTRIVGRYADRLLELRGEMLARTETMTALHTGRDQAMRQAIESGKINQIDVVSVWRATGDDRTRHTHRALNGQAVDYGQSFVSPSGATLRYPGDPQAPASEIVGCRCHLEHKIDFTGALLRQRAN